MNLSWNWIQKASELLSQNKKFAIATITNVQGSTPREIGAKMIVVDEHEFYGTIGGGALEAKVIKQILSILGEGRDALATRRFEYTLAELNMVCGGNTEVVVELINSHPDVYIFGAGHCGLALANVLQGVPFNLHVIDERQDWLDKFPANVNKYKQHWSGFIENAAWSQDSTFVVIMSPGHCDDRDILERVVTKSTKYLGLMGSKTKWVVTKAQLVKTGSNKERLDQVHCPIGHKIGGKTPAEIAVSISAELISNLHNS